MPDSAAARPFNPVASLLLMCGVLTQQLTRLAEAEVVEPAVRASDSEVVQ